MKTAYTCPALMALTRIFTRGARWEKSDYGSYRVIVAGRYEASCPFPAWMIHAECWAWNTLPGLLVRKFVLREK